MSKIKKIFLILTLITTIPTIPAAQNNTDSPYSRYGYGVLGNKAFTAQRAMGGIGYGLRDSKLINPMNPASFSAIDSMTFMIEMGVYAQVGTLKDGNNSDKKNNANIEYLAMQFPLAKRLGVGLGFEPVSFVGYKYGKTQDLAGGSGHSTTTFKGTGGLNQVYGAISYDFLNRLSLGVKVAYLFGNMYYNNTENSSLSNNQTIMWRDTLTINGPVFDLGFQYRQPIGKNKSLVFGGVYTPKIKVNSKEVKGELRYDPLTGSVNSDKVTTNNDSIYEMPEAFAFGITYNLHNKLTIGADILHQRWADVQFNSRKNTLSNLTKYSVGGEYIPNIYNQNFFNRVRYRAGFHYSDSYVKIQNHGYKEYGASVGLGLPLNDRRSSINLTFEYSKIHPDLSTLVSEDYFKITVSYTFNEWWFIKRKLQ